MGQLVFQATLGGQVNLVGPNTASTFNLDVPAVNSTLSTTSGTETLTNKTLTTPVINGFTGSTAVVNIGSGQFYKDTAGNIGVGVTPSAWSGYGVAVLEAPAGGTFVSAGNGNIIGSNWYYASSAFKYKTTAAASYYYQVNGESRWYNAASGTAGNNITFTQAMTLFSSGALGLGTTSDPTAGYFAIGPDSGKTANSLMWLANTGGRLYIGKESSAGGTIINGTDAYAGVIATNNAYPLQFGTNNAVRATIDSSGNLLVGTATSGGEGGVSISPNTTSGAAQVLWNRYTTSALSYAVDFRNAGSTVGYISYNNAVTSFVSVSDYRLKNTVAPMTGALAKVALLKPCTYKWNIDASEGQGFIAHELAEIVPDCVTGEKDAVDAEGKPQYQGIDTSFLVATLTAAIQEQQALITSLTARLDAANI
jgi:hypothetical protein